MKLCDEIYFIWGSNPEILSTATKTLFNNSSNETNQTKLFFEVVRKDCSEKAPALQTKSFLCHYFSGTGVQNIQLLFQVKGGEIVWFKLDSVKLTAAEIQPI